MGLLFLVMTAGQFGFCGVGLGGTGTGRQAKVPGFVGRAKSGGDSEERECGSADVVVVVCGSLFGAQRSKEGKTRIRSPRVWGSGSDKGWVGLGGSVWRRVGVVG